MRSTRNARARSWTRRAVLAASAVSLCLPLAACGAPGASTTAGIETPEPAPTVSADATVPEACTLLSADLIEAATGVVGAGEKLNKDLSSPGTSVCDWKGSNGDLPSIEVLITALTAEAGPTPGPTPAPAPSPNPSPSASGGPISAQRASAEAAFGPSTDVVVAGGIDAFALANGSVVGMTFEKVNAKKVKLSYYVQVTYTTGDSSDVTLFTRALAALVATSL